MTSIKEIIILANIPKDKRKYNVKYAKVVKAKSLFLDKYSSLLRY